MWRRLGRAVLVGAPALLGAVALAPSATAYMAGPARRVSPLIELVATTGDLSQAMSRQPDLPFAGRTLGLPVIRVEETSRYQVMRGFGAALTDSSAWLIHERLAPATRATVMRELFTSAGIDLGFLRVPIGASDFTVRGVPYTYDDWRWPDPLLRHFTIGHDLAYIAPTLREVMALNRREFLLATPWTPPAWMKRNRRLDNIGHSGQILPAALPALARYLVKFVLAYRRLGIPVAAVTPQNEPGNATRYPGAELSAAAEAAFISRDLAPAIRSAGLRTRVYGYDRGWSSRSASAGRLLAGSPASRDISGIASHCYFGSPTALTGFHAANPRLDEIVSECSPGLVPFSTSELAISATRNWASTVALWNLALDRDGRPVEAPNTGCPRCRGVITIDQDTHTVVLTRDYYQLGQFSRFIRPGAVRIASAHFTSYSYRGRGLDIASPGLDDVAFQNPDGSEVLVAYNNGSRPTTFDLASNGRYAAYTINPRETVTMIWNRPVPPPRKPYGLVPAATGP
jgi:glucosylceramidase